MIAFPRRSRWATYAPSLLLAGAGMAALGFFAWMLLSREAAEPLVRLVAPLVFHNRRHGWNYDPSAYGFYAGMVAMAGVLWLAIAVWVASSARQTEARLDAYLAKRIEQTEARNTRAENP